MLEKGKAYKKLATTKKTTFTKEKLKKGTYYKFIIIAENGGAALATSKPVFIATSGGKVANPKAVTVKKTNVNLKRKETFKLGAEIKKGSGTIKNKRKLKYESSNEKVAVVDKNGKIKAVGKGKCCVYAYAQNGAYKKVKVEVR